MCGIAGIALDPDRTLPNLQERLLAIREAMTHRGPDDAGLISSSDDRAGLVNRRLAVRDLSPAGHMPMSNADATTWITHNGEIYNTDELRPELERLGFVFHSESDTEVILHGYEAWGDKVVRRLRGMFAFAILALEPATGKVQRLFLARDRLGIKPLYYAQAGGAFLFASELKAMLASGLLSREISPAGLVGYLMFGSVPNPWTIYCDVQALPPACVLAWQAGRVELRRYWHLPTDTIVPSSYTTAVEQVRTRLEEAVRIRLAADVPLGAFLSGGLDSGAVVALMRQATSGTIRTCSMVFEEHAYSESVGAGAVARAMGTEHYERMITARDVAQDWERILWAMDQPTVDGVNTYFASKTAREAGLTVALSGLGGDELFGGYPNTFQGVPQVLRALELVQAVPGGATFARRVIHLLPDHLRWSKVSDALTVPASPASAYVTRRGLFSPSQVKRLVTPDVWQAARRAFDPVQQVTECMGEGVRGYAHQPFAWVSRAELGNYTHHQLLRDTDVMSMAHSLEVRVPLLDHHLVEAMLRLPAAYKAGKGRHKSLLLQAVGEWLPPKVRDRRDKQGFTFPFADWLRADLKPMLMECLEQRALPWLRPDEVQKVATAYWDEKVHWTRPWALAVCAHFLAGRE
jgi:asparagine synthase (glutamine-hydrolysing)